MSENLKDAVWKFLYPYIADEDTDEDYSAEMAERLCEKILPTVWDVVTLMADKIDHLEAQAERWKKSYTNKRAENIATITDYDSQLDELKQRWKAVISSACTSIEDGSPHHAHGILADLLNE